MHRHLGTGGRLLAAPVMTAALVAAGVTGLVLGPRVAEPPADPGTTPVAVTVTDSDAGVQLGPATKYVREDDGTIRRLR